MPDEKPPVPPAPESAPTREEFDALKAERDKLNDQWLRAKAEFSNYQKRVDRDREQTAARIKCDFLEALLPALDGLDLALKHVAEKEPDPLEVESADPFFDALLEGVRSVRDALHQALDQEGVERIPAKTGSGYDPDLHEVTGVVERAGLPEGAIVEEVRPGYRIGKLVIRHSAVMVAKPPEKKPPEPKPADG